MSETREPDIWLQSDENEGIADCGCRLIRDYIEPDAGTDNPAFIYCPKHAAAPDLLEACKELSLLVEDFIPNIGTCALQNYQRLNEAPTAARAAIAKAEPAVSEPAEALAESQAEQVDADQA